MECSQLLRGHVLPLREAYAAAMSSVLHAVWSSSLRYSELEAPAPILQPVDRYVCSIGDVKDIGPGAMCRITGEGITSKTTPIPTSKKVIGDHFEDRH
jgi:hypothetical protein